MSWETLDARSYLAHLKTMGQTAPDLGKSVLLALHPAARPSRSRSIDGPFGSIDIERRGPRIPTVSPLGPGSAVAAMTVDLLAALGVETIVGVGVGSEIGSETGPCAPIVINAATANNMVSEAYGGQCIADGSLSDALASRLGCAQGLSFTTSTPFRLDQNAAVASGAAVIDMEAAALFASAHALGIKSTIVIVPSDTTGLRYWQSGDHAVVSTLVKEVANQCRSYLVEESR